MADGETSSKPTTDHWSGTRMPALPRARMAPNAVMSSKAISGAKRRRRCSNSSVICIRCSKLENGSPDSGRSTIRRESSSRSRSRATARTPRQRDSVSDSWCGWCLWRSCWILRRPDRRSKSGIPSGSQSSIPGYASLLYNPATFAAPRGLTFGDSGRNSLRNPGRKVCPLLGSERITFQKPTSRYLFCYPISEAPS